MINRLYGTPSFVNTRQVLLRTEGGIEWDITVSQTTMKVLATEKPPISLFIHLYHKDDTHTMFGFATTNERHLFRNLLRVNGVGPRHAINILSEISTDTLVAQIQEGNHQLLCTVPGIGTKSAQRIVLSLRGSVQLESTPLNDIEQALVAMGYAPKIVQPIVAKLLQKIDSTKFSNQREYESALIQRALKELHA